MLHSAQGRKILKINFSSLMAFACAYAVGQQVAVKKDGRPDLNGTRWTVVENDQIVNNQTEDSIGRYVLESCTEIDGATKRIRVKPQAVFPLVVALVAGPVRSTPRDRVSPSPSVDVGLVPQDTIGDLVNFNEMSWNLWFELPLHPGNYLMIVPRKKNAIKHDLLLYPVLEARDMELWFRSQWLGDEVQLKDGDGISPCPGGHKWPYCFLCGKFHLPLYGTNSHRESKKHLRNLSHGRDRNRAYLMMAKDARTVRRGGKRYVPGDQ